MLLDSADFEAYMAYLVSLHSILQHSTEPVVQQSFASIRSTFYELAGKAKQHKHKALMDGFEQLKKNVGFPLDDVSTVHFFMLHY